MLDRHRSMNTRNWFFGSRRSSLTATTLKPSTTERETYHAQHRASSHTRGLVMNSSIARPESRHNEGSSGPAPSRASHEPASRPIRCVGVVGLGHMGAAFAQNLLSDGYEVIVEDRDAERAQALQPHGARVAARLADLAPCDAVITSLPNDEVLASVALLPDGLAAILAPSSIHISMSTVSPGLSRRLADVHAAHGQGFVAAPCLASRTSPMPGSCS